MVAVAVPGKATGEVQATPTPMGLAGAVGACPLAVALSMVLLALLLPLALLLLLPPLLLLPLLDEALLVRLRQAVNSAKQ